MNKTGGIFEILWFVTGGLLLFIGGEKVIDAGFSEGWKYLALGVLSLIMYFRRRHIRLSENK